MTTPVAFDVLYDLAARRRDVRRFRTDPVDESTLDELLRLVELAPSVGNSQPWRWVRVASTGVREQLCQHFDCTNKNALQQVKSDKRAAYTRLKLAGLREAPIHYAVFCDTETNQGGGLGRQSMPETLQYSVVCAIMSFWLGAKAKGLGVGWVSILEPKTVNRLLSVPPSWDLVAYLCVGYPIEEHVDPELERAQWQHREWRRDSVILR
ncbi:MAG: 5,6-dimethylbenzimidazole synthase [Pseudomonadota bacterium]